MLRASPTVVLLALAALTALAGGQGCAPALVASPPTVEPSGSAPPTTSARTSAPMEAAAPLEAAPVTPAVETRRTATSAKEEPMGAIVIDDLPSDTAEVYEDDVPMTFDVGEAKPIGAGTHIVSLVVATKTVWASKITVVPGNTVHVHIPPKYLTAYQ